MDRAGLDLPYSFWIMEKSPIILLTVFFILNVAAVSSAKVPISERDLDERRELRSARKERIREYEKFEADNDLDREKMKKRSALWKKEQAKLTQDYRQLRSDRLQQLEAEKEKESAARARQKEIRAQMSIDESEYKAELVQRKMEVLYGQDEADSDEADLNEEKADKKPFWEKWLTKNK